MPLERLENENKRLRETCMRSELENEMLALELVNDRVRLKGNLDQVRLGTTIDSEKLLLLLFLQAEDRIETLTRELQATKLVAKEGEQHTMRLTEELENV